MPNDFFSDPIQTSGLPGLGGQESGFANPFNIAGGSQPGSYPLQGNDLQNALDKLASSKPSYEAQSAPTYFDWDANQTDRYVQSEYYKELGFRPNEDNESRYGYRQTWGDTMQQAFAGMGSLAWNTFVEGWKGWGNMMDALFHWDASRLVGTPEELAELDRQQKEIMNKYAIFSTPESEQSIFSRQFLGNMIQQSGFALGTVAQFASEELLTMGMATALKPLSGARSLNALLRAGITHGDVIKDAKSLGDILWKNKNIVGKIYNGLKTAGKYTPLAGGVMDTAADLMALGKVGATKMEYVGVTLNGLRRTLSEANMSFTEARMEAAGTYADLKDKLYNETLRRKGSVSPDEEMRIEQLAQDAAWDNFKVNAGVISVMNRIQFDNLFKKFGADKRILREMAGEGNDVIKVSGKAARDMEVTDALKGGDNIKIKAGEEATKIYNKGTFGTLGNLREIAYDFGKRTAAWEAAKSMGRNLMKFETTEGIQELIQEGSNEAIKDYYKDLYDGSPAAWGQSIEKAAESQMSTQGAKTFLMGALTGRFLSPINFAIGKAQERLFTTSEQREQQKASKEEAIDVLNAYFADPTRFAPETIANLKGNNKAAKIMEQALRNNDQYAYEHAKDGAFAKTISAAKKLNLLESLTDTIRQYGEHFDEKEFREAFGVDFNSDNRRKVKEYVGKIADDIEKFSKRYDELRNEYADLIQPERYAGDDQLRVALVKRSLDDAIEWMATNEYRAKRTAERALSIMDEAAKLPTVAKTAHYAFRTLGDSKQLDAEIALLKSEISAAKGAEQTKELIELTQMKESQLQSLLAFKESLKKFDALEEHDQTIVDDMMGSLKAFLDLKNVEFQSDNEVSEKDLNSLFFRLMDYRKLSEDQKNFMDAYNLIANPKNFVAVHARIQEALLHLRGEQIKDNQPKAETKKTEKKPAKKDEADSVDAGQAQAQDDDFEGMPNDEDSTEFDGVPDEYADTDDTDVDEAARRFGYENPEDNPRIMPTEDPKDLEDAQNSQVPDSEPQNSDEQKQQEILEAHQLHADAIASGTPKDQADAELAQQLKIIEEKYQKAKQAQNKPAAGNSQNSSAEPKPQQKNTQPAKPITTIKVGNHTVNIGDSIVDVAETLTPATFINIKRGQDGKAVFEAESAGELITYSFQELANMLKTGHYKIVRKGEKLPDNRPKDYIQNGEIRNPEEQDGVLEYQRADVARLTKVHEQEIQMLEDGKKKVISALTITNRSTEFSRDQNGNEVELGIDNPTYQTLLGSQRLKSGTKIYLKVDDTREEWPEVMDYEKRQDEEGGIILRKKSDIFENGKIKDSAVDDFPVAIYANIDGKEVKLGYLSTMKRIDARYTKGQYEGRLINIVEVIEQDGTLIDNYKEQREVLKSLREKMLAAYNEIGSSLVVDGSIGKKSDGTLRIRPGDTLQQRLRPLSESIHPGTTLGIVKAGRIYTDKDTPAELDDAMTIYPSSLQGKEGWVVALLPTPTGKTLVSFVKSGNLGGADINLILEGYKAFWDVKQNGKNAKAESIQAVKFFHEAVGAYWEPGAAMSFSTLREYVNNYVTFLSGREYNATFKPGLAQFNITDNGELSYWMVDKGAKDKDLIFARNLADLERQEDIFRSALSTVYYNTKLSDSGSYGLNSDKKIKFVTFENGKFKQTKPMTYNELQFEHLQTNIKGRPTDEKDLSKEWIYFDNPVSSFTFVDLPMKLMQTSTTSTSVTSEEQVQESTVTTAAVETATSDEAQKAALMASFDDIGDDLMSFMPDMDPDDDLRSIRTASVEAMIDNANLQTTDCK